MDASNACLKLTRESEGLRLTAYRDGRGRLTIGWGHSGPDVKEGMTITQGEAERLFLRDIARAARGVRALTINVRLTQGQFDALTDFVFNLGTGNLAGSTLLRRLRAGDYAGAAAQFPLWDHEKVNGEEVEEPGLKRRRLAEQRMFLGLPAPALPAAG